MNDDDKLVAVELRRMLPSQAHRSDAELLATLQGTSAMARARLAAAAQTLWGAVCRAVVPRT